MHNTSDLIKTISHHVLQTSPVYVVPHLEEADRQFIIERERERGGREKGRKGKGEERRDRKREGEWDW